MTPTARKSFVDALDGMIWNETAKGKLRARGDALIAYDALAAAPPAPTDTEAVALLRELVEASLPITDRSIRIRNAWDAARTFLFAQPPAVDAKAHTHICPSCHEEFSEPYAGPCPECGKVGVESIEEWGKHQRACTAEEMAPMLAALGKGAPPADIERGGEAESKRRCICCGGSGWED